MLSIKKQAKLEKEKKKESSDEQVDYCVRRHPCRDFVYVEFMLRISVFSWLIS